MSHRPILRKSFAGTYLQLGTVCAHGLGEKLGSIRAGILESLCFQSVTQVVPSHFPILRNPELLSKVEYGEVAAAPPATEMKFAPGRRCRDLLVRRMPLPARSGPKA